MLCEIIICETLLTWWERVAEEGGGGESLIGVSDQTSRSAVEVCGFLTGVFLSIFTRQRRTR